MKNLLKIILLAVAGFVVPKISFGQFVQWLGTKDNIVDIRNILRADSAIEFPLTDTLKHPTRPGRLTSFNGLPYWYDGIRWTRLRGDTSTLGGQVNSDWNATSGVALILNKPTLSTVAISGSYTDLSNKPTIPAAQIQVDWSAASGITSILNKPRMVDSIWKDLDSIRIRVRNNDNTFRTFALKDSVGSGGGSGTVQVVSVGNLTPIFGATITGSPTVNPTISFTLSNAANNTFLGNITGSTGPPSYSAITVGALPGSIPVSKTLLTATAGTGIVLSGNNLVIDTIATIATQNDVSLKQDRLNGTGYVKQVAGTTSYSTPTQVTADLNLFTTTLQGLVPAPATVTGKVLSDNGTWITNGGSGGAQSLTGDVTGTLSGTNIVTTLATVNTTVIGSSTLVKQVINGKGLTTNAIAANAGDLTTILGYTPLAPADTVSKIATKFDLTKLDTVKIIPSPSAGTAPVAMFGRNDSLFAKRFINAIQNNDSSITVGNMIAANNLNDVANKNSALNTILPSQTSNAGKILSTDGTNTSWIVNSGGSGVTNLGNSVTGNSVTITSSTGTPTTVSSASHVNAGPISAASQARIDSIINFANTRVGDSIGYMTLTQDTIYLKGIDATSSDGSLTPSKNHTQQKLSYDFAINVAHSNTFTAPQTFGQLISTGNVFLSATTYQPSNGKLDYIIQDTTTGRIWRTPYIPIDSSGAQNGYVLTWNTATGKATFISPGSGGTVTNFSAGSLSPLFTTSVATSTTTPALTFALTNAPANSVFGSIAGGAPSYFNPSLTSSLFANEGTSTTVLKGNNAGNPVFGSVVLTTDVSGQLPSANGGVPSGGTTGQGLVKNSSTNYDYSWINTINSIVGTTNQINVSTVNGVSTLSAPQNLHTAANTTFGSQTLGTGDLTLSRTDQSFASILRPNTTGAKDIRFSVVGGGGLDNFTVASAASSFSGNVSVGSNLAVSGSTSFTGKVGFGPAASAASFNIPLAVVPPSSPVQGDAWSTAGHLFYRDGSTTYDLLSSGGITNLNGLNSSTQTFVTGGSGSDFNISSVGSVHTFNIPDAGNGIRGVINPGTQSIYGTKTFINAPILTGTSVTNQVWTATSNAGTGIWSNSQNIYNNDGILPGNRAVALAGNTLSFNNGTVSVPGASFGDNTNGGIELGPTTSSVANPYIDFHYGAGSSQDYNVRLMNDLSGVITVSGASSSGTFRILDGNQGVGKVFTSDATGKGSWTTAGGSFSPTVTNVQFAGTIVPGSVNYQIIGNVCNVTGRVRLTPTTTSGTLRISINLPVSSTFISGDDAAGTLNVRDPGSAAQPSGRCYADNIGQHAVFLEYNCTSTSAQDLFFQFNYLVH